MAVESYLNALDKQQEVITNSSFFSSKRYLDMHPPFNYSLGRDLLATIANLCRPWARIQRREEKLQGNAWVVFKDTAADLLPCTFPWHEAPS